MPPVWRRRWRSGRTPRFTRSISGDSSSNCGTRNRFSHSRNEIRVGLLSGLPAVLEQAQEVVLSVRVLARFLLIQPDPYARRVRRLEMSAAHARHPLEQIVCPRLQKIIEALLDQKIRSGSV